MLPVRPLRQRRGELLVAAGPRGQIVAGLLAGSWRPQPPAPRASKDELREAAPLLLASGSGALAWWRIRGSDLADGPAGTELHEAYRLHAIRAAVHDLAVAETFRRLRRCGVEAILVKGWAAARLYPQPGLRPYGDIDLLVRPADLAAARAALEGPGLEGNPDLHGGGGWLSDRPWPEILDRSRTVPLGDTEVRMAGPEDHLRYLCLHLLGHGAWRPLWLCDVAAALESLPDGFDWEYFMGADVRRAEWAAQAVALAERLLGARRRGASSPPNPDLPHWFVRCVLREWGRRQVPHGTRIPMASVLRQPSRLIPSLWERWPNPVEATLGVGARFDGWPRAPFQVAECAARGARFVLARARG